MTKRGTKGENYIRSLHKFQLDIERVSKIEDKNFTKGFFIKISIYIYYVSQKPKTWKRKWEGGQTDSVVKGEPSTPFSPTPNPLRQDCSSYYREWSIYC